MPVAKSYQQLNMCGDPYEKNGRQYVIVECKNGHRKEVRWYTQAEYEKMYPESTEPLKKIRPRKEVLGFSEGYIWLVKGNTSDFKEWLLENGATYRTFWGWAFPSTAEMPSMMPAGLSLVQLTSFIKNAESSHSLRFLSAYSDSILAVFISSRTRWVPSNQCPLP